MTVCEQVSILINTIEFYTIFKSSLYALLLQVYKTSQLQPRTTGEAASQLRKNSFLVENHPLSEHLYFINDSTK